MVHDFVRTCEFRLRGSSARIIGRLSYCCQLTARKYLIRFKTDFPFYLLTQGDAINFLPLESLSSYSFPQGGASL